MSFIINNWYLFLALIVIVYLLLSEPILLKSHGVKLLEVHEALRLMNDKSTTTVDVRQEKEFAEGHLPKTRNIPLGLLANRSSEIEKAKKKPVIVVCRSGNRSKKGAITLAKNGFEQVYSMNGGVVAWQRENLPLEK